MSTGNSADDVGSFKVTEEIFRNGIATERCPEDVAADHSGAVTVTFTAVIHREKQRGS